MIDRRSAVAWFPGMWGGLRKRQSPPQARYGLQELAASPPRPGNAEVPWNWSDVGRALLMGIALAFAGAVCLLSLRILFGVGVSFGSWLHVFPRNAFQTLTARYQPYTMAAGSLIFGLMLYGSLLFALYYCAIRRYNLPWSSLYLRIVGMKTYGAVAALFVPVTLGGLLVTRLQVLVMGDTIHNPQAAMLTRGMPPLALNFLLLFILLAVITPIAEEVFFRAFLYRLLRKRLPIWAAASISSAAFATVHGVPVLFPWLFYMGIVFALVTERTRSIFSSMLLHGMTNALATLSIIVALTMS